MTTLANETDYAQFVGQNVKFTHNLPEVNEKGEGAVEVEGNVQLVNGGMLLIKPRGQVKFTMIPLTEIEGIGLVETSAKKFKASKLKPVKLGDVRRHLLDRHGVQVTWANSVSEQQAKEYHDSLNHADLDLGHLHMSDEEAAASDAKKADAPAAQEPVGTPEEY